MMGDKNYNDIIKLERPVSTKHPPMDRSNRAAQFSPFAALTGHDAAIKETARLTQGKIELDDSEKIILDEKIRVLEELIERKPLVSVTHFVKDMLKEGGTYMYTEGSVCKVDRYRQALVMSEGEIIAVDDIVDIESEVFADLFL
ncbi:MAG: hypothetical protein IJB96_11545 [Lachnospira sp.]|nr:hypothetical protein [Lachnospira sp.]